MPEALETIFCLCRRWPTNFPSRRRIFVASSSVSLQHVATLPEDRLEPFTIVIQYNLVSDRENPCVGARTDTDTKFCGFFQLCSPF
jgi:hypothetical protein